MINPIIISLANLLDLLDFIFTALSSALIIGLISVSIMAVLTAYDDMNLGRKEKRKEI